MGDSRTWTGSLVTQAEEGDDMHCWGSCDLVKVKDIRAWILNPHTFELFRQMIRDAMISAHLDLKAIHRDDWNTYVCNDRVIHTIQEWNSLIL